MTVQTNLFSPSKIKCVAIIISAIAGTGYGIYKAVTKKEKLNNELAEKDRIIEDLADRYNDLVDKINGVYDDEDEDDDVIEYFDDDDEDDEEENDDDYEDEEDDEEDEDDDDVEDNNKATLAQSLENFIRQGSLSDDDDDEDEEDDKEDEETTDSDDDPAIKFEYEEEDDNEDLCFYPGRYVKNAQTAQNILNDMYMDAEAYYGKLNKEIPEFDTEAINSCVHAVGMLGTAYQMGFVDGFDEFLKMLKGGIKDIKKLSYIDFKKVSLLQSYIVEIVTMSNAFINAIYGDDETEVSSSDNTNDPKYVVPVHRKGNKK